jgi:hypothetical protein
MGKKMGRKENPPAGGHIYFAVLVPHRDCRRLLRLRSAELFAAGFWGAWSFPHAAPLALLPAPLKAEELAGLARKLRRRSLENKGTGMILSGPERIVYLDTPEGFPKPRLYGPALELRVEAEDFGPAPGKKIMPPVLGCAGLGDSDTPESRGTPEDPGAPETRGVLKNPETRGTPETFKFRAAAVANMRYTPLSAGVPGYSFSWKIGKLHWLPPCRNNSRPPWEEG